jgi:uncharacterized membrane protein YphA (DoxX/SURF4 family)
VKFFVSLTVLLHLSASLALFAGVRVVESAALLIGFLVLANWKVNDFWNKEGMERLIASRNSLANQAMIGGLILLALTGPGSLTL